MKQIRSKPSYSPGEVAEIMGVSEAHVRGLIEHGVIAAVHVSADVTWISYGSLMALMGHQLAVTRSVLGPADVEAIRTDLEAEELGSPKV